ncbi:hypothetical protein, conserved [Eimeria praecox]|uniref:REJ domain-containing protein n=1 Tax=Eimeria praecox TaxID=51316 RepID=U6G2Q1_9EIME|nr:hypothetical protein, conserved [Eimeria praecox]
MHVFGIAASGTMDLSLSLEPPRLLLESDRAFSIKKEESVDLVVTPEYCPLVATAFDPGVSLQWTASCPQDSRTADQLLRLSSSSNSSSVNNKASVRPYTLTPGYTYTVTASLRYTADVSLAATQSFTIQVLTDTVSVRFQFAPYPQNTQRDEETKAYLRL